MGRIGWIGRRGWIGRKDGMDLIGKTLFGAFVLSMFARAAFPASPALPAPSSQVPFEQASADLASRDAGTRLRAVQLLKQAAYPEAAIPLAALVTDPEDSIQLEAIAAELNIFLAEPIVPKKRVAFIVEVRNAVQAEPAFAAGPNALGPRPVPLDVLTALRIAARDENPRVPARAMNAATAATAGG